MWVILAASMPKPRTLNPYIYYEGRATGSPGDPLGPSEGRRVREQRPQPLQIYLKDPGTQHPKP